VIGKILDRLAPRTQSAAVRQNPRHSTITHVPTPYIQQPFRATHSKTGAGIKMDRFVQKQPKQTQSHTISVLEQIRLHYPDILISPHSIR